MGRSIKCPKCQLWFSGDKYVSCPHCIEIEKERAAKRAKEIAISNAVMAYLRSEDAAKKENTSTADTAVVIENTETVIIEKEKQSELSSDRALSDGMKDARDMQQVIDDIDLEPEENSEILLTSPLYVHDQKQVEEQNYVMTPAYRNNQKRIQGLLQTQNLTGPLEQETAGNILAFSHRTAKREIAQVPNQSLLPGQIETQNLTRLDHNLQEEVPIPEEAGPDGNLIGLDVSIPQRGEKSFLRSVFQHKTKAATEGSGKKTGKKLQELQPSETEEAKNDKTHGMDFNNESPDRINNNIQSDGQETDAFDGFTAGWLTCISGENRGKNLTIWMGRNLIDETDHTEEVLKGEKACAVIVCEKNGTCSIYPGLAGSYCYLNNRRVDTEILLKPYDKIILGRERKIIFVFIPLIGGDFKWK